MIIADVFGISLDTLIGVGEPTQRESLLLKNITEGHNDVPPAKRTYREATGFAERDALSLQKQLIAQNFQQ